MLTICVFPLPLPLVLVLLVWVEPGTAAVLAGAAVVDDRLAETSLILIQNQMK
jgi:hypothetical protein